MQFNEDEKLHQAAHALAMEYVRKMCGANSAFETYAERYRKAYQKISEYLLEEQDNK